jgi:DNA-binding response OmpR family regulator
MTVHPPIHPLGAQVVAVRTADQALAPGTVILVAPGTTYPPPRPARGLWIDRDIRVAAVDGETLDLTYLEFELLAYLASHPFRVHTRDSLLSTVWGYGIAGATSGRTIDVHITRLRRKLGPAHRESIETVRRVGYRYRPLPEPVPAGA